MTKGMEESRRKIGTENAHQDQIEPDRGSAFDEFFLLFRRGFYPVFKLLHVPIALCYFPLRLKAFLQLLRIFCVLFSTFVSLFFASRCGVLLTIVLFVTHVLFFFFPGVCQFETTRSKRHKRHCDELANSSP